MSKWRYRIQLQHDSPVMQEPVFLTHEEDEIVDSLSALDHALTDYYERSVELGAVGALRDDAGAVVTDPVQTLFGYVSVTGIALPIAFLVTVTKV